MKTEYIKIGNIYIEDINRHFFKKFIILVVMSIAIYVLLAKKIDPIFAILSLIPIAPICFFIVFHEYVDDDGHFDESIYFLHFTTNVNFDDIEKSNVFNIIKTQYEKETIIKKNTKYNYKVKLKIQTDDILDSQYIKNWIQEQRKSDYGTVDGQI